MAAHSYREWPPLTYFMKLGIIYKGVGPARVVDTSTGEVVTGVTSINWQWQDGKKPVAQLTVSDVALMSAHKTEAEQAAEKIREFLTTEAAKQTAVYE